MELRTLGTSGIRVSCMAVGCWAFGGGEYWGEQSQAEVNSVVARALDMGVNLFDTAEMYNGGDSERALGAALGARRREAVVFSKVGPDNAYRDELIAHCEASLKRLNTDYLDVYMLHWPINYRAVMHFTSSEKKLSNLPTIDEAMDAMMTLQKSGKIRAIGVSNFGARQLNEAIKTGAQISVNELPYNIFSRAIEAEIMPLCLEKNVAIVGSMALQQGILAGVFESADQVPMNQAHSRHFRDERGQGTSRHGGSGAEEEMFLALSVLKEIACEQNITLAQLAIAWVLVRPGVASTLVGSRTAEQLRENVRAAEIVLPDDVVRRIDAASQAVLNKLGNNPDYYESEENSRIY